MLKHFGGFVVGVFVGVLVLAVALVGGGYLFLTKDGSMKTVEETVGSSVGMDLSEEQEALSILDYGKGVLSIFGNLTTTPIKDIEATVGINKITTTISDAIGVAPEVIGESSISNLGATLTDNLTMDLMSEKFEVELPDLPLFQDEEFLSKPVSEAFGDLDQNTLDCFIEVVYDEDATEENPASSALMQKLGKKTIKEVSEDMDAVIQDTKIGEVIEIGVDAAEVLIYLKDTKIGELDAKIKEMKIGDAITVDGDSSEVLKYLQYKKLDEIDGAIKDMKIGDAITIHEEDDPENGITKSEPVLIYLKDKKLNDLSSAIKNMPLENALNITEDSHQVLQYFKAQGTTLNGEGNSINDALNNMCIKDAVKITGDSHAIMKSIANLKLTELGDKGKLQGAINGLYLKDVIVLGEDPHPIMLSIQDLTIEELGGQKFKDTINGLTLGDVVEINDGSAKILKSLKGTTIGGLDEAMKGLTITQVLDDANVGVLALLPSDTKVQDIGTKLSDAVTSTSLFALRQAGLFNYTLPTGTTFADIVSRIHKNNSTPHEIIGDFTNEAGEKKSITHSIYLSDSALVKNDAFLATISILPGYEGEMDLSTVATKDADGDYVLTPELINNICTAKGIGDVHNVIFYANDELNFKVSSNDNYTKVFSILFADGATDGSIKFDQNLKMENQVGGCAVYVAPTIQVYDSASSAYVPYVAGTKLFSVLKITKTKGASPDVNTWISAYLGY